MTRCIACSLIFLVLFTHSVIAMDVHPDNTSQYATLTQVNFPDHHAPVTALATSVDNAAVLCTDAGGHCSHHQAHTAALVPVHMLTARGLPPALTVSCRSFLVSNTLPPPLRPPKA